MAPIDQYEITRISVPYEHSEGDLVNQPGFDRVVNFQMWFSIFSWILLALVIDKRLRNKWIGFFLSFAVLLFAFSPPVADWDSLIMTESLAFSMFAIILAALIELTYIFLLEEHIQNRKVQMWTWLAVLVVTSIFWVLLRDTNVYFLPLTILYFVGILVFRFKDSKRIGIPVLVLALVLGGTYIFHQATFTPSYRWLVPFYNNVTRNIFPYPERVAFFQKYGMPVTDEILSFRGSQPLEAPDAPPEFVNWARENGLKTYTAFLVDHPVWAMKLTFDNLDSFFEINLQPYFFEGGRERPNWLLPIANFLHPFSPVVIIVDTLLTLLLVLLAIRTRNESIIAWAWIGTWVLGIAYMLMVLGFLGEMRSTIRHVLGGVMPFRLYIWILLALVADFMWSYIPISSQK